MSNTASGIVREFIEKCPPPWTRGHIETTSLITLGDIADVLNAIPALLAEMDEAKAKNEEQRKRIVYLEGATNHACGTPLSACKHDLATLTRQRDDIEKKLYELNDIHTMTLEGFNALRKEFAALEEKNVRLMARSIIQKSDLTRQRDGLREAIPFPDLSANSADAIAYELECEHPKYTTTKEAKAVWLRDIAKQLRAFEAARKETNDRIS